MIWIKERSIIIKYDDCSLPDSVKIKRIDEKLSALGNVIACNDYVAMVHPEISKETEKASFLFFKSFLYENFYFISLVVGQ